MDASSNLPSQWCQRLDLEAGGDSFYSPRMKGKGMPKKTDLLKVTQEGSKTEEGRTTLTFMISAPEADWKLPDILASQEVIPSLEQTIREAVQKYFESAAVTVEKLRNNRKPDLGTTKETKSELPSTDPDVLLPATAKPSAR